MTLSLVMTFVAWFVGGFALIVTGMGGPLLALPIMLFFVELPVIVVTAVAAGLMADIPLIWRFWRHVDWKRNWLLVLGSLPGVVLGALTLKFAPLFWLQLGLGLLLLLFVVWQLLVAARAKHGAGSVAKVPESVPGLLMSGAASGFFSGSVGLGGPPVAMHAYRTGWDKDMARGVFGVFFGLSLSVTVLVYLANGLFTPQACTHILAAAPGVALGSLAGLPVASRLPQGLFQRFMLLVVFLGGVCLLYKAFFM